LLQKIGANCIGALQVSVQRQVLVVFFGMLKYVKRVLRRKTKSFMTVKSTITVTEKREDVL